MAMIERAEARAAAIEKVLAPPKQKKLKPGEEKQLRLPGTWK